MRWQERNGILVPATPARPLEPILVFIDETYLQDRSGLLQAAFPVTQGVYDSLIVPRSRELLAELGPEAKEFKGGSIKRGNVGPYREFLKLFTGVSVLIADRFPLYPVVSIDGSATYSDQQFQNVLFNVEGALQNLNINDAGHLAAEFSRQMLWLHRHLPLIAPSGFRNEVVFTVDAKYLHAEQSRESRFFSGGRLIAATVSTLETTLSSCARTLFADHRSEMRLPNIGRVARFRFVRSPDEFGLQAADVLCHLLYSALRAAVGITDATTAFKVQLLNEVMPDFELADELRSRLTISTGNDGRQDVSLNDPNLRSRFQILPVPEGASSDPAERPVG